jgi:type III secretory pathway component EscS
MAELFLLSVCFCEWWWVVVVIGILIGVVQGVEQMKKNK